MGWLAYGSFLDAGVSTAITSTPGSQNSGVALNFPPGVRDGDEVWLSAYATQNGTAWATPTGWTRVGSAYDSTALGFTASQAFFKKTWHTGDPTTVSPVTPGAASAICFLFLIRPSGGSYSVITDATATGSGNTAVLPASSPSNTASDLRIAFIASNSGTQAGSNFTFPAVAINGDNLGRLGYKDGYMAQQTNFTKGGTLLHSIWSDPAGSDSATTSIPMNGGTPATLWWARVIDLNDGTSINGSSPGDLIDIGEAVVDAVAWSPEQVGVDADSANAKWWGGGVNTLGDAD